MSRMSSHRAAEVWRFKTKRREPMTTTEKKIVLPCDEKNNSRASRAWHEHRPGSSEKAVLGFELVHAGREQRRKEGRDGGGRGDCGGARQSAGKSKRGNATGPLDFWRAKHSRTHRCPRAIGSLDTAAARAANKGRAAAGRRRKQRRRRRRRRRRKWRRRRTPRGAPLRRKSPPSCLRTGTRRRW